MTHLLIDADLLLYRAASASENEVQWDEDCWVLHGNLKEAIDIFRSSLDTITNDLSATQVTLCLSDRENFRKTLAPTYKSSRKSVRKPVVFRPLMDFARNNYTSITWPTLEADDVIGILSTHPDFKGIVVSDDKDMQTLATTLYRSGQLTMVTPEQADRYWMLQTLTGDPTDGYSGVPGIGPKTAEKLLTGRTLRENWPHVVNAYRAKGMTEEDAVLNARLSRILRHGDWNDNTNEVKLWTPSMIT